MNVIITYFNYFLACIVLIMLGIIYLSSTTKHKSTFDRFVDKLEIVVGIFIAIGVILTAEVFRRNLHQSSTDTTLKVIDRGWIRVNREILRQHKHCPRFIDSLYYDWQKAILKPKYYHNSYQAEDDWTAVNYLSVLIFQSIEDFLSTQNIDETGNYVWLSNFLQWVKSPILQHIWLVQKSNYTDTTKDLVDLLIKVSNNTNIQNEKDLTMVGKQIDNSPEFKQIYNQRLNNKKI